MVTNTGSPTLTWRFTREDPMLLPFDGQMDTDGTARLIASSITGATVVTVEAVNSAGATSAPRQIAVAIVVPPRIQVSVQGSSDVFDRDAFRQQIAQIFGVSVSQVIVVAVAPGSVVVTFYIAGLQPALTAGTFIQRAQDPNDPLHSTVPIASASLAGQNATTAPRASTTSGPSSLPPLGQSQTSEDDDTLWLGLSTRVWIVIVVVIILLAVLCCVIGVCVTRKQAVPANEVPPKPRKKARPEEYRVAVEDDSDPDEMLPQRASKKSSDALPPPPPPQPIIDKEAEDVEVWSEDEEENDREMPPSSWYEVPATQPRAAPRDNGDWRGANQTWFDSRAAGRPSWMSRRH